MAMDELDLLKKHWQQKEKDLPKLTYNEIYQMIWKRSSSIVKWIFYISIIEFAFWSVLSFLLKDMDYMQRFESYHAESIIWPITAVGYAILFYFIYQFFMNYRKISVTNNATTLMKDILKTRKTVKQYVWFNILYLFISGFVVVFIQLTRDEEIKKIVDEATNQGNQTMFYLVYFGAMAVMLALMAGLILLIYRFVYGTLLRRLNRNYEEIKRMEV